MARALKVSFESREWVAWVRETIEVCPRALLHNEWRVCVLCSVVLRRTFTKSMVEWHFDGA
jgi:hypothetical protein